MNIENEDDIIVQKLSSLMERHLTILHQYQTVVNQDKPKSENQIPMIISENEFIDILGDRLLDKIEFINFLLYELNLKYKQSRYVSNLLNMYIDDEHITQTNFNKFQQQLLYVQIINKDYQKHDYKNLTQKKLAGTFIDLFKIDIRKNLNSSEDQITELQSFENAIKATLSQINQSILKYPNKFDSTFIQQISMYNQGLNSSNINLTLVTPKQNRNKFTKNQSVSNTIDDFKTEKSLNWELENQLEDRITFENYQSEYNEYLDSVIEQDESDMKVTIKNNSLNNSSKFLFNDPSSFSDNLTYEYKHEQKNQEHHDNHSKFINLNLTETTLNFSTKKSSTNIHELQEKELEEVKEDLENLLEALSDQDKLLIKYKNLKHKQSHQQQIMKKINHHLFLKETEINNLKEKI